jgi:hypothetical protein
LPSNSEMVNGIFAWRLALAASRRVKKVTVRGMMASWTVGEKNPVLEGE